MSSVLTKYIYCTINISMYNRVLKYNIRRQRQMCIKNSKKKIDIDRYVDIDIDYMI